MIAALRGSYRGRSGEWVVVDVGGVGYEVLLPPIVEQTLGPLVEGMPLDLKIAYVATRDQPTPVLYGFAREEDKQFWALLKSVARVGPRGAARAMVLPINRIAQAIQEQNTRLVDSLPGISAAGAEKIVATLRQKVATFAALEEEPSGAQPADDDELKRLSITLLVEMGIKRPDATRDVTRLLKARPELRAVEDVVMEYFRT
jgi:Holliday junction DNA helicase RuvA